MYTDNEKHGLLAYSNIYARAIMNKTRGESLEVLKAKDKNGNKLSKLLGLLKEARLLVDDIENMED